MKRGLTVAVAGAAILVAGLSGCSSNKSTTGSGETTTGIAAVLTDGNPPEVKSVGLGNVNGVTLGYTSGTGQGNASATKDGSHYKITGTATGVDMANPMSPVNKSFEIEVTCS